ncbi:MAG: hypothetical protein ACLGJC_11360, partial [Alphaproteobacteria bacterium]
MRQVFSRWPSLAETSAGVLPDPDGLPAWMTASTPRRWPVAARDLAISALLVFAPVVLAAVSASQPPERQGVALLTGAAALLSAALAVLSMMRLKRETSHCRRQYG